MQPTFRGGVTSIKQPPFITQESKNTKLKNVYNTVLKLMSNFCYAKVRVKIPNDKSNFLDLSNIENGITFHS